MWTTALLVAVCFGIGNFIYQAFGDQAWMVAFERSYFQATAIAWFSLVMTLRGS